MVISIFVTPYLLGLLPNIWSRRIIHYTFIGDILARGFLTIGTIGAIVLMLAIFYLIGDIF